LFALSDGAVRGRAPHTAFAPQLLNSRYWSIKTMVPTHPISVWTLDECRGVLLRLPIPEIKASSSPVGSWPILHSNSEHSPILPTRMPAIQRCQVSIRSFGLSNRNLIQHSECRWGFTLPISPLHLGGGAPPSSLPPSVPLPLLPLFFLFVPPSSLLPLHPSLLLSFPPSPPAQFAL